MRSVPILWLSLVVFFIGCSDETTTEPENGDLYQLEVSQTIGSAGGVIEIEGFALTVPDGAFDGDHEISIYSSTEDQPFGDDEVSRAMAIGGFPLSYTKSVRIGIRYQGSLTNASHIAAGKEHPVRDHDDPAMTYAYLAAIDSSGYLVTELPAGEIAVTGAEGSYRIHPNTQSGNFIYLHGITGSVVYFPPGQHFTIAAPARYVSEQTLENLGGYLEEAYDLFLNELGFSYDGRTTWPVEVFVKELDSEIIGKYSDAWASWAYGSISMNLLYVNDSDLMRIVAGHEFFHLVQSLYDPRDWKLKAQSLPVHVWLDEASSVWAEEFFTDSPSTYVSIARTGLEDTPLYGFQKGVEYFGAIRHGYGLSALLKHMLSWYGQDTLVEIYESIKGGAHAVEAIISNTQEPSWWFEQFFRDYILGHIYNVQPETWAAYINAQGTEWTVDSSDDTFKTFSFSSADLSVDLFRINLDYPEIDSSSYMTFDCTADYEEDVEITAFRYKEPGDIGFLGHGNDGLTVSDIRTYYQQGYDIFAMVSNSRHVAPYTGTSPIDLHITIERETPEPVYTTCAAEFFFIASMQTVNTDPETTYVSEYSHELSGTGEGAFSGNTFTGTWDYDAGDGSHQGTVTVILDEAHQTIVSMQIDGSSNWDIGFSSNWDFSAANIPMSEDLDGELEFAIFGDGACDYVTGANYQYFANNITRTLLDYSCDEWSYVRINFWSE